MCVCVCMLNRFSQVSLCDAVECGPQASLSMGFSRQEYWSGLPFAPLGDPPDPRTEPTSPVSPALANRSFTTEPPGKPSHSNSDDQNRRVSKICIY